MAPGGVDGGGGPVMGRGGMTDEGLGGGMLVVLLQ